MTIHARIRSVARRHREVKQLGRGRDCVEGARRDRTPQRRGGVRKRPGTAAVRGDQRRQVCAAQCERAQDALHIATRCC